ncbi:nitrate ABC transporter substrate-binding protein [Verrucomicrobia bacterium LW23]|nr:nitrate ABC transporter substrate-binding protein [Verrucomicrobia bacterium LW23]
MNSTHPTRTSASAAAPAPVTPPSAAVAAASAGPGLSRRGFMQRAGLLTAGVLLGGLPKGWVGAAYASDAPETADMKIGMIALTDCSPIIIAHEKGLFKKYGINSTVAKGASWAAIRDSLQTGDLQATHMLIGMPIASTMGLLGSPKRPMIIPWLLNRNGQAISLKAELIGKVDGKKPQGLKDIALAAKAAGNPMTFAMTFPPGTHAMWMRYWLATAGLNPDADVNLITIPPAQMAANMKVGKMDGFCVGEPWNARVVAEKYGFTALTTQDLWKDHPEKVLAFSADFAEKNPKTVKAALKAIHEASVWLDDLKNRPEQAAIVSATTYISCPKELIEGRLLGNYDYGDGRTGFDPNYMIFHDRNCNYPQKKYCTWWLSQFRRWGMVTGAPDYEGVAKQVMRPDIYEEAMKEIGYAHGGADDKPETLFDGKTFDPAKPEEYAASFEIKNIKG